MSVGVALSCVAMAAMAPRVRPAVEAERLGGAVRHLHPRPHLAALAALPLSLHTVLPALPAAAAEQAQRLSEMSFEPRGITPEDTIIFILGTVPFVWAGIEFWRRIAVGDPFGTGSDSVIINDSSGNRSTPVRRVLGQDAIIAARILFALAFASGALVIVAGLDVLGK